MNTQPMEVYLKKGRRKKKKEEKEDYRNVRLNVKKNTVYHWYWGSVQSKCITVLEVEGIHIQNHRTVGLEDFSGD